MAGTLRQSFAQTLRRKSGERFWVKKALTSSGITTSAQDLTTVANGDLKIIDIVLETDATGLNSTGNAFTITKSGDSFGASTLVSQVTSGLGANVSLAITGDTHPTTGKVGLVRAGGKLQYQVASSAATGAGILKVSVCFERVDENADIKAV